MLLVAHRSLTADSSERTDPALEFHSHVCPFFAGGVSSAGAAAQATLYAITVPKKFDDILCFCQVSLADTRRRI